MFLMQNRYKKQLLKFFWASNTTIPPRKDFGI